MSGNNIDCVSDKLSMPWSMRLKLSVMMFLQYMILPVWFNTFIPYIRTMAGGESWVGWCGALMGFGMLASPLLCMFADRFLNAEKVLALCNFVGGVLLVGCYYAKSPALLFWLLFAVTIFYMPTWSLVSGIAMANSTTAAFPHLRVFGTLGWIASAVFSVIGIRMLGITAFDKSPHIFAAAAGASILAGLLALILPATPPRGRGTPMSVVDAFGLKAFALFAKPVFCVFAILLALSMVPFQWYMSYNTIYLDAVGFKYLNLTQNLGQVGELALMLLLPLILRKCGYKWSMVLGLVALTFRYVCFYGAVKLGAKWLNIGGILMQGLIFGLLVVGAQMYVDVVAPSSIRNQAQGLVMLLTGGVGVMLSVGVFHHVLTTNTLAENGYDWQVPFLLALVISLVLTLAMIFLFRPNHEADAADVKE